MAEQVTPGPATVPAKTRIPISTIIKLASVILAISGGIGQYSQQLGQLALPGHWNMYLAGVGVVAHGVTDTIQELMAIFTPKAS